MNEQLLLTNIRSVLIRQEETIIFALIERAQFRRNTAAYQVGALREAIGEESIVGYLLRETEKTHARMRRYLSPDEHPFYVGLPAPVLPPLRLDENPLQPNRININPTIRVTYEGEIVPYICGEGDDGQYGSTAVCDVQCLQSLSRRIHYGKFVAESKYRLQPERYDALIAAGNREGLMREITDAAVEEHVLERVRLKSRTYGQDTGGDATPLKIDPERVAAAYARWIIPLTKEVQVLYLLGRK